MSPRVRRRGNPDAQDPESEIAEEPVQPGPAAGGTVPELWGKGGMQNFNARALEIEECLAKTTEVLKAGEDAADLAEIDGLDKKAADMVNIFSSK
jgi:hypothetical protein